MENPETETTEGEINVTEWRIQRQRQQRGKQTLHNGQSRDRYNRGENKRYRMDNLETDTTEGKINVTEWTIQRQIHTRQWTIQRQIQTTQKHNTICAGYNCAQTNTNNVNKTNN